MQSVKKLLRDESGMSYVFIGMGLMAFLGASMLAIDVGMLMTARAQAQNAADAGALAGALALAHDDWNDRTPDGPAVRSAIMAAQANDVMGQDVSVTPADVEFVNDPLGQPNRVRVSVYRRASRGNPVATLIAQYFGMTSADIGATATAEVSPANAVQCPLPFTIPDRWTEVNSPPWDPIEDDYDAVDKKGVPVANPDIYIGLDGGTAYTGYRVERDRGVRVVLKADNGSKLAPSMYQVWDTVGGDRGSDDVRDAIANCSATEIMGFGQTFVHKPGLQMGPVEQGISDLIAKDPDAYWDPNLQKVITSHPSGRSPRVRHIPVFDPHYYDTGIAGGRNASLKFVNYLGFFVEDMRGGEVIGVIAPIGGLRAGDSYGPASQLAFPKAIRLVQ